MDYEFDYPAFVALFPEFSNTVIYPEILLSQYWTIATNFLANSNYGLLAGTARGYGINLLAAHITAIAVRTTAGVATAVVTAANIDKTNVTMLPPPVKDAFDFWLNSTPYGQQLAALLSVSSVGGFVIGGSPVYGAYRDPCGNFR